MHTAKTLCTLAAIWLVFEASIVAQERPTGTATRLLTPVRQRTTSEKNGPLYQIHARFVEVEEDMEVSDLMIRLHHPWGTGARTFSPDGHSFTKIRCSQCHEIQGQRFSPELLHDSLSSYDTLGDALSKGSAALLRTWPKDSEKVKILAAPRISLHEGTTGNITTHSRQNLEFFEPTEDGMFRLKRQEFETGISLEAGVQTAGEGRVRLEPLSVSVSAITGREPLPGTKLDVGRPIVATKSLKTSITEKLGDTTILAIDSPRGRRVLIALSVTRQETED